MIDQEDDDDRRDYSLQHYENKLLQKERDLYNLRLHIAVNAHLAELQSQPGWAGLMKLLGVIDKTRMRRLRTERLDQYRLGWLQGSLDTLGTFCSAKPAEAKELAEAIKQCSDLEAQIADLRNVVAQ